MEEGSLYQTYLVAIHFTNVLVTLQYLLADIIASRIRITRSQSSCFITMTRAKILNLVFDIFQSIKFLNNSHLLNIFTHGGHGPG